MAEQLRSERFMTDALDTWAGSVYRLALAHTHSPADAQDIVQDVFLSLLKSTVEFQDEEHEKAWLLHVAANRCKEYHRSAWRRRVEPFDDMGRLADREVDDPELEALFEHPAWAALEHLPDKLRIVVHLHDVEGYASDAIADILGIFPATVRTRLHRARKKLREELDPPIRADEAAMSVKGADYEPQSLR